MWNCLAIALVFLLFADADVPMVYRLRARAVPVADFPSGEEIAILPLILSAEQQAQKDVDAFAKGRQL